MVAEKTNTRQLHDTNAPRSFVAPPDYQTDPARMARLGVVCGGHLFAFRHVDPRTLPADGDGMLPVEQEWELPPDYDLCDLGEAAAFAKIGAVWLVPVEGRWPGEWDHALVRHFATSAARLLADEHAGGQSGMLRWHPITAGKSQVLAGLVCQWTREDGSGVGAPISILAPWTPGHWGMGAKLGTLPAWPEDRARVVATAAALASYALRMQLRFSPSYVGLQMMRQVLAKKSERIAIPPLGDAMRDRLLDLLPMPFMWRRPIADDELTRRDGSALLFKFDRTMSYPASAGEVPVGMPCATPVYEPHQPGVYHLAFAVAPAGWGTRPGLFYDATDRAHGGYPRSVASVWAWEPQIRLAERLGWSVLVDHGYTWPRAQCHDLFRPWRERVFAAREACAAPGLGTPGTLAAALCKLVGVAAVGRLIQDRGQQMMPRAEAAAAGLHIREWEIDLEGELTGMVSVDAPLGRGDLVAPHWWGTIIANANERLQSAICEMAPEDSIAGYVDAVYTLGNHPGLAGAPDGTRQLGRFRLDRISLARAHDVQTLNKQEIAQWVKTAAHLTPIMGATDGEGAADGSAEA